MSKLYNTLEKIRHNESGPVPAGAGLKQGTTRQKKRLHTLPLPVIVSILVIVLLAATVLFYFKSMPTQPVRQSTRQTTSTPTPSLPAQPSQPQTAEEIHTASVPIELPQEKSALAATLNELGVKHIEEMDYWRGFYYLERASKLEPANPTPLINMAVGLTELGLIAPAKRLYGEAFRLAPDNARLQENIALMKQLELAEANWLSGDALTAPSSAPHKRR